MSNESKAQAISGVIIGIGIISILLNITIWKSILVIAGIIIGTLIMAGVYVVLKMLAWTILDDIDEAKERRKEEERREELRKKKKSNVG